MVLEEKKTLAYYEIASEMRHDTWRNDIQHNNTVPQWCVVMMSVNGIVHVRQQCMKATVLSCHIYLIMTGVEKMNNI